ncbi:MAG: DUF547 domain-containing protein [Pseudomonadota bacterium]
MQIHRLSAALAAVALVSTPAALAQSGDFAVFAEANGQGSTSVDYGPYREFFSALSVQERGRTLVAYDAVRESAGSFLAAYANGLSRVDVTALKRDDQLAFWLNARNMLVVKALSEERSLRGFDNKRGTPMAPGPLWTEPRITINGVDLSIQDIETEIILAGWDSPYVLYGLYQGLEGGPPLRAEPFLGETVHATLTGIAQDYTDDRDIVRVRRNTVRLGEFYEWYAPVAFDGDSSALLAHVSEASGKSDVATPGLELDFKSMSTSVEQFRVRQRSSGGFGSGSSSGGGFGRGS